MAEEQRYQKFFTRLLIKFFQTKITTMSSLLILWNMKLFLTVGLYVVAWGIIGWIFNGVISLLLNNPTKTLDIYIGFSDQKEFDTVKKHGWQEHPEFTARGQCFYAKPPSHFQHYVKAEAPAELLVGNKDLRICPTKLSNMSKLKKNKDFKPE